MIVAAFVLFLVPVAAIAVGPTFSDVPSTDWAYQDIEWLAANGLTNGCTADGTAYCPDNPVTRREMAAFTHRLATSKVVEAKTAASSEVKIRYSTKAFYLDVGATVPGKVQCATAPMVLDGTTTVVASGGFSLEPNGTSATKIHGSVHYTTDGGAHWYKLEGVGVEEFPAANGTKNAGVPVNAAANLGAGTYKFAIYPIGDNYQGGVDYVGYCELTVTAYTGLGTTIDFLGTP